ncbi:hypothetical protein [Gloeobacter kilaueensis]|uniref:hypothetical protein n=1 Tax=Gloeobacter kilaueensis TaxID=1416614 RepID=UPI0016512320|nr:hypothetical protein [Gloeobacter kilaueensis]
MAADFKASARASTGRRPALYRWVGWLLLVSGLFAVLLSSYFRQQVQTATEQETTLAEDAGLSAEALRSRLVQVQGQLVQLEGLRLTSQVQALQLLTRLAGRYGLTVQAQFRRERRSAADLLCTLSTSGSETAIWSFLTGLDNLHERSRGSVALRSYELTSPQGNDSAVQLRVELTFLTRTSRELSR